MLPILFVICLLLGILFLSGALVVWLVQLSGSMLFALLVVAAIYLVVAFLLYILSLRPQILRWQQRLDTIYDVSATFEALYVRVMLFVKKIVDGLK